jgi:TPR repeat protein
VNLNTLQEDSSRASAECSRLVASNATSSEDPQAAKRACQEAQYKALRVAAQYGDAEAQYAVGAMTEEGSGVAQSDIEAVKWYQLAVAQDYGDAHWRLGLMYQSGRGGLSESLTQAVHHLMRALWRKSETARTGLIDGRGASLTPQVREAIQSNLTSLGYYSGAADGTFDQATIAALEQFSAS